MWTRGRTFLIEFAAAAAPAAAPAAPAVHETIINTQSLTHEITHVPGGTTTATTRLAVTVTNDMMASPISLFFYHASQY